MWFRFLACLTINRLPSKYFVIKDEPVSFASLRIDLSLFFRKSPLLGIHRLRELNILLFSLVLAKKTSAFLSYSYRANLRILKI